MKGVPENLKNWKYYKLAIILFAIVFLVVVLIVTQGEDTTSTVNQTVTSNDPTTLWNIAQESRHQYNELRNQFIALQLEHELLKYSYESTQLKTNSVNELLERSANSAGQVAQLEGELAELRKEIANLRVVLQVTTDQRAFFEQSNIRIQYEKTEIQNKLDKLWDRVSAFTGYIAATSNLTSENVTRVWENTAQ